MANPNPAAPPAGHYDFERTNAELAADGLVFNPIPFRNRWPGAGKHTLATGSVLVGDHEYGPKASEREIVIRCIRHLGLDRPSKQSCFAQGQDKAPKVKEGTKGCQCCDTVSSLVRHDCNENLEDALDKWVPRFTVLVKLCLKIVESPDEDGAVHFLSQIVGMGSSGGTDGLYPIVRVSPNCTMRFCFSLFYDIMGYESFHPIFDPFQKLLRKLYQKPFLSNLTYGKIFCSLQPSLSGRGKEELVTTFALDPRSGDNTYTSENVKLHWLDGGEVEGINLWPEKSRTFNDKFWKLIRAKLKGCLYSANSRILVATDINNPLFTLTGNGIPDPHFADAVGIDLDGADIDLKPLLSESLRLLIETAGSSGKQLSHLLQLDAFCPSIVSSSPNRPPTRGDCLRRLLQDFGLAGDDLDAVDPCLDAFWTHTKSACLALIPNKPLSAVEYELFSTAAFRVTTRANMDNLEQMAQVPHLSPSSGWIQRLVDSPGGGGRYVFKVTVPLCTEGCYTRIHESSQDQEGKIVFTPHGQMFIRPASLIEGDGFRAGILGNPRMHFLVALLPGGQVDAILDETEAFARAWANDHPSRFIFHGLPPHMSEYSVQSSVGNASAFFSSQFSLFFGMFGL